MAYVARLRREFGVRSKEWNEGKTVIVETKETK